MSMNTPSDNLQARFEIIQVPVSVIFMYINLYTISTPKHD